MNGHKNVGAAKKRGNRQLKLSPTTRAIRTALALSAAMLALSGSNAAFAGTCTAPTDPLDVTCTGIFTDDVANHVPVTSQVPDLTVVLDEATTVNAVAGDNGITSNWGGDATVISYGEINVEDGIGIYVTTADGSGAAENMGEVYAHGVTATANGVHVYGHDDATITNSGSIEATADAGFDAYGASVNAYDGTASIDNSGTVRATSADGLAEAIYAYAYNGSAVVTNDGEAFGVGYNAYGLDAVSFNGTASADNSGYAYAFGDNFGTAVEAVGWSGADVSNSGEAYAYGVNGSWGVFAYSGDGATSVTTTDTSEIEARSLYSAYGIYAYGYDGATVANAGHTYAYAGGVVTGDLYAVGIVADSSDGDVSVTNSGYAGGVVEGETTASMSAYGVKATEYAADGGDASISNSGTIVASATGYAYSGLHALGAYAYSYDGDASITNTGTINASVSGYTGDFLPAPTGNGNAVATGASAYSYNFDASVTNSGLIDVSATSDEYVRGYVVAGGIYAGSYYGNASITNSGTISAEVNGYAGAAGVAYGAWVYSYDGNATVTNSGSISLVVNDTPDSWYGPVINGIHAYSYNGDTNVTNSGTIEATANAGQSYKYGAYVTGIHAQSEYGNVVVTNSGDIEAVVNGGGSTKYQNQVYGIHAIADYEGSITITNSGTVNAHLYADPSDKYFDTAFGVLAQTYDGNLTVTNSGSIDAISTYGNALGVSVYSTNGDVSVTSSGTVGASSEYTSFGIYAGSGYGAVSVTNSGTVSVAATGGSLVYYDPVLMDTFYYQWGDAAGIVAIGQYDVTVTNSGLVEVAGYSSAAGVVAVGYYADGQVTVTNSGTIDVVGGSGYVFGTQAVGVYAQNFEGDIVVDNSGLISVGALTYIEGYYSIYGATAIGVKAYQGDAYTYGDGNITVDNSGTIEVSAFSLALLPSYATGVDAFTNFGDVSVDNSGLIDVAAESFDRYYGPKAIGITAYSGFGSVDVGNSGTISVLALADNTIISGDTTATGVVARSYYGEVTVDNSGLIDVEATAVGTSEDYHGYGNFSAIGVSASGAFGGYIPEDGAYGIVTVNNSGTISASATGGDDDAYAVSYAVGVYAQSLVNGYVEVNNDGVIDASASTGANTLFSNAIAHGVVASSSVGYYHPVSVSNSGEIYATATVGAGDSIDNQADAYGVTLYSYDGNTELYNVGAIVATASAGGSYYGYSNATGVSAIIGLDGYGQIDIYNGEGGYIGANAENTAIGIEAFSEGFYGTAYVGNFGEVQANAIGGYVASSTGVTITAPYAVFDNGGTIAASAESVYGPTRTANATGVWIDADYVGYFTEGEEAGTYVFNPGFHNEGEISASASGEIGSATGVHIDTDYVLVAYNDGEISASAEGAEVTATGFRGASANYGVYLFNSGDITATAEYQATGVWLNSPSYVYIYNYGTIEASGAELNNAIDTSSGGSPDSIYNYGTITGAIVTGAGDDYLYNGDGGTWNATGASDFGDGDDDIYNYGLIAMTDATIDLGFHDVYGNYFDNYGVLSADGDNVINMGHGPAGGSLVPSLNPNAFYNYGTITFQDGAADDSLTIIGDFAGDGNIDVDVSGLNDTSDHLYIDGSVVAGTVGTINVDVVDLSQDIEGLVPMVYVSGDSDASNFVLGDVTWDEANSFVTLDFDLVADIDDTNTDPDVFALGIAVTGLSDVGTLAANIPGSVQSLMNSSVGTWRQRMGVIDQFSDGAVALWARIWTDKGGWNPEHHASFGDGGNFDWDQKNSGFEAGVDFAVSDEFSLGLLVGKSEADVDLDEPGVGSADLDADTWGLYGTWISPTGFYLDASYRWMSFDVDMNSVAGGMEVDGDAESFNLEMGYAWTLSGGLKIEPQFQYTKTNVDELDVLETSTGMTFHNEGGESSRGRLGVALRKSFGEADAGWLWTPYVTLSAVREFDGETLYTINNDFHGETTLEGTSTLLELGFTARHQNWSIYGGLNWQDGGAVNNFFGGQLGVRYTFGGPAPVVAPPPPPPPAKTCADLDDDRDGINNCDDHCPGSPAGEAVGPDGCPVPPPAMEPKPFRG